MHQQLLYPSRGVLYEASYLSKKERHTGDVKVKVICGCSDHEMVELKILRGRRRVKIKLTTLDVRRAGFGLLKHMTVKVLWDKVVEERGTQEIFLMFEGHLLQFQE